MPRREFPCEICGAPVVAYKPDSRYCSMRCAADGRRGARNCNYNGGLSTNPDGRTIVVFPNGSHMLYSRALMAGHVGRLLRSDEMVHHINGDKLDDRIENLRIVTRAEHLALHRAEYLVIKAAKPADKSMVCAVCSSPFLARTRRACYCSRRCRNQALYERHTLTSKHAKAGAS